MRIRSGTVFLFNMKKPLQMMAEYYKKSNKYV